MEQPRTQCLVGSPPQRPYGTNIRPASLKAKDGSWYARFYDEVPDGNGALRSKERWKKLGRIEDYPRERDIFPVFEGFMQAVNDRLMGAAGPDPSLRVFIEQKYLPSLRLEKKTVRGYTDTVTPRDVVLRCPLINFCPNNHERERSVT